MNVKKSFLFLLIAIVIVTVFQFLPRRVDAPHNATAQIGTATFSLIVVDTPETRELGLGGRNELKENEAMLFIFDFPAKHEFWMKGMRFPIDILWLDRDFQIVHIAPQISPDTYPKTSFSPEKEALYVLETVSGFSSKNGLKVGDKIEINLKK